MHDSSFICKLGLNKICQLPNSLFIINLHLEMMVKQPWVTLKYSLLYMIIKTSGYIILKLCNEYHFTNTFSLFGTEVTNVSQTKSSGTRILSAMTSLIIWVLKQKKINISIFLDVSLS